jgi:hypothetical protein
LSKCWGDRGYEWIGNSGDFNGGVIPTPAVSESAIGEKKLWFGSSQAIRHPERVEPMANQTIRD